jgi:hypothetical protein
MLDFEREDLVGRILALNTLVTKTFSCGGFSVNYNRPMAVVTTSSQQQQLKRGLLEGKLIDVTDQNKDGLNLGGARQTKPNAEDTGETVFVTVDQNGGMMIAIPKDQEQKEEFEKMIAKSGVLILDSAKISDIPSPLQANRVRADASSILLNELASKLDTIKR